MNGPKNGKAVVTGFLFFMGAFILFAAHGRQMMPRLKLPGYGLLGFAAALLSPTGCCRPT